MGKWMDRLEAIKQADADDDLHNAKSLIRAWRYQGREVFVCEGEVVVSDMDTLPSHHRVMLRQLQPHLLTAMTLDIASA